MDDDIRLSVQEQTSLLANSLHYFGVAVTGIRHSNSAGEIQQLFAIISVDVSTFSAVSDKIEDAAPGGSHVREIVLIELIGHVDPFFEMDISYEQLVIIEAIL